jgi:UDPglucose--hexose-1-phosphate uridylyltransferase
MAKIDQVIKDFVAIGVQREDIAPLDQIYVTNRLLELLDKTELENVSLSNPLPEDRLTLLDEMVNYAVQEGIIEDLSSAKDVFGSKVMNLITPKPSEVNRVFWESYQQDPEEATDYFFELSKQNNYIKTREIAKNIEYTHQTEFGQLDITINLSKPEKDPKEIALAKQSQSNYPVNLLCMENEGYSGHISHPGRSNHRIIRMDIHGDSWGFQYSPYAYYNEHAIFLSEEHRPMNVGIQAIKNLLEIITQLPHYFVGSNAGLPIVGGSILSHDHYQGGRYTFALEKAESFHTFSLKDCPSVQASVVKWPMSVVRLASENKEELIGAAEKVMNTWEEYSDEETGIRAYTNQTPHNAITPIARRKNKAYELDLVLRNNRTSDEYPDGIFHPHPPVQHIKKENIGLIEVMGLAILPARLKEELEEVRQYLLGEKNQVKEIHQKWADDLKNTNQTITKENVGQVVEDAVGEVFLQVLKDAGVFKQDEQGKRAFIRFIEALQLV